jgi:hypothetical protein
MRSFDRSYLAPNYLGRLVCLGTDRMIGEKNYELLLSFLITEITIEAALWGRKSKPVCVAQSSNNYRRLSSHISQWKTHILRPYLP